MQDVVSIISNVGFPIACVIACGYFIYKFWLFQNESNQKREDKLYNQLEKFSETMEKLNDTLNSIDNRLTKLEIKEGVIEDGK